MLYEDYLLRGLSIACGFFLEHLIAQCCEALSHLRRFILEHLGLFFPDLGKKYEANF